MRNATLAVFLITWIAPVATADVLLFDDRAEWESAVGSYTTIDFTGGENFTFINDDYAGMGVTFGANAHYWNSGAFENDLWGLRALGGAWVTFDSPQKWLALDYPGAIRVDLYSQDEYMYTTPTHFGGIGGAGLFGGLLSDQPFDMVYLHRIFPFPSDNNVFIDDLHFGIPAPGTLALFAVAGLLGPRRCRQPHHVARSLGTGRSMSSCGFQRR